MKITPQLVKRFKTHSTISTKYSNFLYKEASALVTYANGYEYEVVVCQTHPLLWANFSNNKDYYPEGHICRQYFLYPESKYSQRNYPIPEELKDTKDILLELSTISMAQALVQLKEGASCFKEYIDQLVGHPPTK